METTRVWLDGLYAVGRAIFTFDELRQARSATQSSMLSGLSRAQHEHLLCSPARGLYVIVPPEYRVDGAPPWQWYLDAMLRHLGARYYVGLLTAAAQHGASSQAAQQVQVVVDRQVRPRVAGRQRLVFIQSPRARSAPTVDITTPTGRVHVSTPEMTMLDLVSYPRHAAGWGNITSVLLDLAPLASPDGWKDALRVGPATPQVQRLGYLLEQASARHTDVLADWLAARRITTTPLLPGGPRTGHVDARWRVVGDPAVQPD